MTFSFWNFGLSLRSTVTGLGTEVRVYRQNASAKTEFL